MIPTRGDVIECFEGMPYPLFQRWSSWSTSSGEVMLQYRDQDHVERCGVLESIGHPKHDIERLSRIDWYALRTPGYDDIDLWQVRIGFENAIKVDPSQPAYEFFSFLFREAGGFDMTDDEAKAAEREAADIHAVDSACYR